MVPRHGPFAASQTSSSEKRLTPAADSRGNGVELSTFGIDLAPDHTVTPIG